MVSITWNCVYKRNATIRRVGIDMSMCKRPSQSTGNVIRGPWKKKAKREIVIPDEDIVKLQEDLMFCDNLTEHVMVQMIHTLGENGFKVNDDPFLKDMGFIIEGVRSCLYREMEIVHPMSKVIDVFVKSQMVKNPDDDDDESKTLLFSIDEKAYDKVIDTPDDEKDK